MIGDPLLVRKLTTGVIKWAESMNTQCFSTTAYVRAMGICRHTGYKYLRLLESNRVITYHRGGKYTFWEINGERWEVTDPSSEHFAHTVVSGVPYPTKLEGHHYAALESLEHNYVMPACFPETDYDDPWEY